MNDKLRVTFFCQESSTGALAAAHREAVQASVRSSDGRTLYTASRDTDVGVWRIIDDDDESNNGTLSPLATLTGHDDWVNDAVLVDDERVLVTASSDTSLKVWRVADLSRVSHTTLHAHADYATALAHAPLAHRFFSVGLDARCYAWSLASVLADDIADTSALVQPCGVMGAPPTASIYAVAATPDGRAVLTGAVDRVVRVWDPTSPDQAVLQLLGHTDLVRCVAVDRKAQLCLSASTDRSVRLWDLRARRCVRVYQHHDAAVWSLAPDDRFATFLSGDRNGRLFLTDVETGESRAVAPPTPIERHEAVLHTAVRWRRDEPACDVALCTWQHDLWSSVAKAAPSAATAPVAQPVSCRLWRVDTASGAATSLAVLPGRCGVRRCTLLPDRRHALSADDDGTVRLWDLCRARELCSLGRAYPLETVERCLAQPASLRAWSSVKPIGGRLAVVVDALQALQCRTYANEAGFASARHKRAKRFAPTARVNVGERVLAALFRAWIEQSPSAAEARVAFEKRRDEAAAKKAAKEAKEAAAALAASSAASRRLKNDAKAAEAAAKAAEPERASAAANGVERFATADDAAYRIASDVKLVLSDRVTGATMLRGTVADLAAAGELAPWLTAILVAEAALAQTPLPSIAFRLVPDDANTAFELKDASMTATPLCKVSRLVTFVMRNAKLTLPRKADLGSAYRKFKAARRRAAQEQRSFQRRLEVGTIDGQFIADCLARLDAGAADAKPTRRRHRRQRRHDDESSASSSSSIEPVAAAAPPPPAAPEKAAKSKPAADVVIAIDGANGHVHGDSDDEGDEGDEGDDEGEFVAASDYIEILVNETVLPMTMDIATAKSVYWRELDKDVEFRFRVNPVWKSPQ